MRRKYAGKIWLSLAAFFLCAGLLLFYPELKKYITEENHVSLQAERQLVTVWIKSDTLGASSWLRAQAAAYQKAHEGVHVWVRTVTQADLDLLDTQFEEAAPDVLLFMAGEVIKPAWLQPIFGMPLSDKRAQAGQFDHQQLAVPLCMAGYALVQQTEEAAATPAPTSLFGVTPAPDMQNMPVLTPVPRESWPTDIAADNALGAAMLSLLHAPQGARLMDSAAVQAAFLQNETQAALLSTMQARALRAQGKGMEVLAAAGVSDLVLFGAIMRGADEEAQGFLAQLLSTEAQRALTDKGLFSARSGIQLYGADTPVLQAVEAAMSGGWLPNAFAWPAEKQEMVHTGQVFYETQTEGAKLFE